MRMPLRTRKLLFVIFVLAAIAYTSVGCSEPSTGDLSLFPAERLPAEVQSAPATVRQAYQFAAANPDVMQHIPCYCGCGAIGHASNYACYISGVDDAGNVTFDNHALGCSICVDITQDAMRLVQEGKSVEEIKAFVDETYAQYGPSNMP